MTGIIKHEALARRALCQAARLPSGKSAQCFCSAFRVRCWDGVSSSAHFVHGSTGVCRRHAGVICLSRIGYIVSARPRRGGKPVRGPLAERAIMAFPEGRPRARASVEGAPTTPVDVIAPATSRLASSLSSAGCRCRPASRQRQRACAACAPVPRRQQQRQLRFSHVCLVALALAYVPELWPLAVLALVRRQHDLLAAFFARTGEPPCATLGGGGAGGRLRRRHRPSAS